jgi:Gluconate 2-dehydrogenase subunit 3
VLESAEMSDEGSLEAIRAVVEAIAPATDGRPGAVELGIHRHVADSIDAAFPGFVDMLAMLLDAYGGEVRAGARFADLTLEERGRVLRSMGREETQDMQELVGALFLFTYGGLYSEWTGYDRSTGRLDPPAVWEELGYRGPVAGNPGYREQDG